MSTSLMCRKRGLSDEDWGQGLLKTTKSREVGTLNETKMKVDAGGP